MKRTFKAFCFHLALLTGSSAKIPRLKKQETASIQTFRHLHHATVSTHCF